MTGPQITPASAEAEHFWKAVQQGQLLLQQCLDCERWQFYPRTFCTSCSSFHLKWQEVSGNGIIYACTLIHRAPSPALQERTPYLLCLVELAEGVRMMSRLADGDFAAPGIGDAVRLVIHREPDGTWLPLVVPEKMEIQP